MINNVFHGQCLGLLVFIKQRSKVQVRKNFCVKVIDEFSHWLHHLNILTSNIWLPPSILVSIYTYFLTHPCNIEFFQVHLLILNGFWYLYLILFIQTNFILMIVQGWRDTLKLLKLINVTLNDSYAQIKFKGWKRRRGFISYLFSHISNAIDNLVKWFHVISKVLRSPVIICCLTSMISF